ncbi:tetraspanin-8 [Ahaetulla prasina]|uniref:tetraspanin-8 n=1 Tax=Ahaetulla prasina TaxID=499056 RepID=UPI00264813D5|nr:tetraspanin-8 [Ahaetulla prasina]XP_058047446.1 tetraspanin-8 [Ahaetulla prasina]XP_058047447.1 tetraspanin-8 [Ahaetulla prasina]XP_058047448.1 tetraspanin-8 [Ahaetulla prasina]XP_058047450.1 tetraspanin-8 [Ahaetulla prasina]XP_058047451.1 tetraspanin-8 [Ahaetulla prasina]
MAGVSSCMKYSMFVFNFFFWIIGCIILGVSIWIRVSKDTQEEFKTDSSMVSAVNLLIAVGSVIMVLGFLGCCGAMKESQCMLLLFFIGLLMILLLQIIAGILGAVYKSQFEGVLNQTLEKEIDALKLATTKEKDILEGFHKLEIKYKCCGMLKGQSDWGQNLIPYHGCECNQTDIGTSYCVGKQYAKTCATVVMEIFKKNMVIVMGIAFGLAFIEIVGMVFSMTLYCQIQNK